MITTSPRAIPDHIASLTGLIHQSTALSCGNRSLTYQELDHKAEQFAAYLVSLGVSCGGTVAICMERSFDWIVSALGIMRAGAAYVPLDSNWPESRLRFAVSDCGATALVARTNLLDRLQIKAHGIDPGRDAGKIECAAAFNHVPIDLTSLAYVIYTSGSSGVPKGVEITHANLNHLIQWHRSAFHVTERDRASHVAGLAFDVAVWEIWPNLAAGATVCLADDEVRSSPELLQSWLVRERITIAFVPTILCAQLIAMDWPHETALRVLLTGGDILQRNPAGTLPFKVVNNYGTSECSVVTTSTVLESGSCDAPTIGRPIDGAGIYLLNEEGHPVGDGVIGEIYIGGPGVGHGYRNLPSLTREKFLPDLFVGKPGSRMYRTGDRGVRRSDGQLEFHGRLDRQVKIRGHRIELDEIGMVLAAHPSIDFAIVIVTTPEYGDNELLAYVLLTKGMPMPNPLELQGHLRQSLPEQMVPPKFVMLNSIPLTFNGKVDLSQLEPASTANLLRNQDAELPTNPIEEKLLILVREILKNKTVGADDNFFLVGGHSLLGMQLVMRVQDAFGVNLTFRHVLTVPTVRHLAGVVEGLLIEDIKAMSEDEARQLLSE